MTPRNGETLSQFNARRRAAYASSRAELNARRREKYTTNPERQRGYDRRYRERVRIALEPLRARAKEEKRRAKAERAAEWAEWIAAQVAAHRARRDAEQAGEGGR